MVIVQHAVGTEPGTDKSGVHNVVQDIFFGHVGIRGQKGKLLLGKFIFQGGEQLFFKGQDGLGVSTNLICLASFIIKAPMVNYVSEWVLGQDPLNRERIQKRILFYSRFPGGSILHTVASAIDLALWDIAGKVANLPVYKMLGAVRDKVPVYCHAYGKTYKETLEALYPKMEKYGYKACKVLVSSLGYDRNGQAERDIAAMFEGVRNAVGDDFEIGIDMSSKIYEPIQAKRCIKAIEPYRPFFAEEPIRPENMENWAEIGIGRDVPIATGEQIFTSWDYDRLLKLHVVDILQPDILLAGGFTGMLKIAAIVWSRVDLSNPSAYTMSGAPHIM